MKADIWRVVQAVAVMEDSPEEAEVEDTPDEEDVIEVRPTRATRAAFRECLACQKTAGPVCFLLVALVWCGHLNPGWDLRLTTSH